jgi:hypothetical protein
MIPDMSWLQFPAILLLYILQVYPGGQIMRQLTRRWRNEIEQPGIERDSLASAGLWIGILERLLIVTFILLHEFSAIGFLIAAKSLLRFSDKDHTHSRKQSEYILIGTLLSFCYALFTTLVGRMIFVQML